MTARTIVLSHSLTAATLSLLLAAASAPLAEAGEPRLPHQRMPASGFVPPLRPFSAPGLPLYRAPAFAPMPIPPMPRPLARPWPMPAAALAAATSRAAPPADDTAQGDASASEPGPELVSEAELVAGAKGIVQDFAKRLKGALQTAMQDGGPTAAVEVCQEQAPQIADTLSTDTGWAVARTSLKHRNPNNAPDAWERGVLRAFEARQADGEDVKGMHYAETTTEAGARQLRFMQAIPTASVCLVCHGDDVPEAVASAIDERYPADRARGYALGNVRGAFSLAKPL